jgi:hypothetical protein
MYRMHLLTCSDLRNLPGGFNKRVHFFHVYMILKESSVIVNIFQTFVFWTFLTEIEPKNMSFRYGHLVVGHLYVTHFLPVT